MFKERHPNLTGSVLKITERTLSGNFLVWQLAKLAVVVAQRYSISQSSQKNSRGDWFYSLLVLHVILFQHLSLSLLLHNKLVVSGP